VLLNIAEPLLITLAFLIAWDYCQSAPLLPVLRRSEMTPVTLEDQRTAEWLTALRPAALAPHTGTRGRPRNQARRQSKSEYTPRHYSKD
jgi:hypothetical protein